MRRRSLLALVAALLLPLACQSSSVTAEARRMRGSPMRTLPDLVAFIDLVLKPGFDFAAAEARLGPTESRPGPTDRSSQNYYVRDADPALRESAIETLDGKFDGVQTYLREPVEVPSSELTRALGPADELAENPGAGFGSFRVKLHFSRHGSGRRGDVYLGAKAGEEPRRIDLLIVRLH